MEYVPFGVSFGITNESTVGSVESMRRAVSMFPPLPLAGDSVTFGEKIPLPISGEVILTVTKSPGWQLEGGRGQVLAWMSRGDMMTAKDTSRFISTLQEAHGPQRSVAFRCPLA